MKTNENNFTMMSTSDGMWEKAVPIGMICECPNCGNTKGSDYKRKIKGGNWGNEPIYLCNEHSIGYEPYT